MDLSRLLRPLVTVNHVSPNYYGGLRSVFSYLPPVLLAIGTGHLLEGTIAAISGQIVALADAGGSFPRRLGQTFGAAVTGMVLVALGVLASGSVVPAALLMAMTAFIGGVVAIYGASGTAFGLLIPISTLITLGIDPPQAELVPLATAALAGGVWASLVSIAPWPFLGRIPAARMVTAVFDAVADQLETIVQCGTAGLHDPRVTESRIELAEKYQQSDAHGRHARIGHKKQGGQFYAALVEDVSIAMVLLRSAQREVDGP